ncbi:hypothetical protein ES708_29600 [subsurface metagenome]
MILLPLTLTESFTGTCSSPMPSLSRNPSADHSPSGISSMIPLKILSASSINWAMAPSTPFRPHFSTASSSLLSPASQQANIACKSPIAPSPNLELKPMISIISRSTTPLSITLVAGRINPSWYISVVSEAKNSIPPTSLQCALATV